MKYITFFGSARLEASSPECIAAKECAYAIAKTGCGIITGGGGGIMQAANEGAMGANMPSVGIGIVLPKEQKPNEFCTELKLHTDLAERKKELIDRADGFVVCAGGFGTLDEMFEVLTLSQTGLKKKPIVLFGTEFWQTLDGWVQNDLLELKLIDDTPMYLCTDDISAVIKHLGLCNANY